MKEGTQESIHTPISEGKMKIITVVTIYNQTYTKMCTPIKSLSNIITWESSTKDSSQAKRQKLIFLLEAEERSYKDDRKLPCVIS